MASPKSPEYELFYWPTFPGRAEPIRLLFIESQTPFLDHSEDEKNAIKDITRLTWSYRDSDRVESQPPIFAVPALRHGDVYISQSVNILMYLAPKLGLAPQPSEPGYYHINGLIMTILDVLSDEVHDTHHPVSNSQYYETQKDVGIRRAKAFRTERLPKILGYLEYVITENQNSSGWLYGENLTAADLVAFQCLDGVKYAFPNAMAKLEQTRKYDNIFALHKSVSERPNIKQYLASEKRRKYGNGLYRHYEELDD